jgi:SAM-dependent methyltransferase
MNTLHFFCDFCNSADLVLCHRPADSERDSRIFGCPRCGLVQSHVSDDYKSKQRVASISSGANWGNIRHGKSLRMDGSLKFIRRHIDDASRIGTVLDIGSNRGDFMKAVPEVFPNCTEVLGIEPDFHVIDWLRDDCRQQVTHGRLEDVPLKDEHFDFVFSSHTLEHSHSAKEMLQRTLACLKPGGLHFLEVPNIENLKDRDIVEEFFIDKHNFHFDREILIHFVKAIGFDVIAGETSEDRYNITLLLKKARRPLSPDLSGLVSPLRVQAQFRMISEYIERLSTNRSLLKEVAREIESIATRSKVAFWGGGRIFDALVRFGDLDTSKVLYAVDTFIGRYLPRFHGLEIVLPQKLTTNRPDCVILLARSSVADILEMLKRAEVSRVVLFPEILQSARDLSDASLRDGDVL